MNDWRIEPKFFCPKCNSEDIELTNTDIYSNAYFVEFTKTCVDCNFQWGELYQFQETLLDLCDICGTMLETRMIDVDGTNLSEKLICPECGG